MKILSRAVVLFCLIRCFGSPESLAQGGWFSQTDPPISDVFAVAYVGKPDIFNQTAVAVDSLGRVLRGTFGFFTGFRWSIEYTGATQLYGLSFTSSDRGTAVGELGTILRSLDGGFTWTPQFSGTTNHLLAVSFVDANIGSTVGYSGTILRTTDGGAIWTPQDSGTFVDLFGVSFVDANNGMAVGDFGTILHTTNGGATWSVQPSGTTRHLQTVLLLDANTAFAIGDFGTLLRSSDGGDTWEQQANVPSSHLYGISFANASHGLAVGCRVSADGVCENSGIILRTEDGGVTWNTDFFYGSSEALYAVSFFSRVDPLDVVIAVGQDETFLYSRFWSHGSIPRVQLHAVSFLNAAVGLAVGHRLFDAEILRTTDGGATWAVQFMGGDSLYGVTFVDANRAIAVGFGGSGVILGSDNGGLSWTTRYVQRETNILGVSFGDANTGIAVGIRVGILTGGKIWRTTDGGYTWAEVYDTPPELYGVSMVSATTGTAVGLQGTILRTTDGGGSWTPQVSPTFQHLRSVSFVDEDTGIAVGYGAIVWTTDGGATWTYQGQGHYFLGVSLLDANTAVAVGWGSTPPYPGVIVRTTDGGATWVLQYSGIALPLRGVSMVDANTGTVVGGDAPERGIILRTETGGE